MSDITEESEDCSRLRSVLNEERNLIFMSNRGPVTFFRDKEGELQFQRGSGGLVTALIGLAQNVKAQWIASASSEEDRALGERYVQLDGDTSLLMKFLSIPDQAYTDYYHVISNPLLWFLQHSIWDYSRAPIINSATWSAWDRGYVTVNRIFAEAAALEISSSPIRSLVMLQDYHLYLAPRMIRKLVRPHHSYSLTHFIHIPWPGSEHWGLLPPRMRREILEGLCAVDLLGFQTREDGLNFIRTVESHLPGAHVSFKDRRVWYHRRATHVRDFPISIDVQALKQTAASDEVALHRQTLLNRYAGKQLIVRIDRTEPSKNIVRGFLALDEMLEGHPELRGKVQFLALLVPSRLEVQEYQDYLDELMAAGGRINARYGDSDWEPVRIFVGENYARAVAALQLYDVLLVNSIADGMNLVAKEGAVVNKCNGVLVLSERTGARQQLEIGALLIAPCDISATAVAMYRALTMRESERSERAAALRDLVEQEDIIEWLCSQLRELEALRL